MYEIPQAGILTNKILKQRPKKHGFFELPHRPGLFKHISRPACFTLVVGNFGIKYIEKENAQHLLEFLKEFYKVKEDWKG